MSNFSMAMALSMVYIILMISNGIQRARLPYRDNIIGTSNTHKHLIIVITEQDQLSVTHAPHQIQSSIFSPNVANYWAKMSPCNILWPIQSVNILYLFQKPSLCTQYCFIYRNYTISFKLPLLHHICNTYFVSFYNCLLH